MKKKRWMAPVMLLVLIFFAACDGSADQTGTAAVPAAGEAVVSRETTGAENEESGQEIVVYYSNQMADGLESETVMVENLTPEVIVGNLARHNIVSIDTKVTGFELTEDADTGRKVITLDLSKAFGEYIKTMGTSGENVIIAALADTFLEAYQADAIKLLVEGNVLETGHAAYADEIGFGELGGK